MAIVHISTSSALFFGKNMGRKAPQGVTPAHLLYGRHSNGGCNGTLGGSQLFHVKSCHDGLSTANTVGVGTILLCD